jgi:outer membrane immunogenic protein
MKRILFTVMLSMLVASRALAADLPQPLPLPPPPPQAVYIPTTIPVYNWGGIYVGLNGGYAFGKSDWTGGAASSGDFDTTGPVVGGTLGANLQFERLVFGVETDLDYAPIKGAGPGRFCISCQTAGSWLGTTRVRAGFAADRVLFYGTAGVAYGNVGASANGVSNSNTEIGWTAGAGMEAALSDNWTARLEYLYVDLSNGSCTTACGAPPIQSISFSESLVRVGVDFKFRP